MFDRHAKIKNSGMRNLFLYRNKITEDSPRVRRAINHFSDNLTLGHVTEFAFAFSYDGEVDRVSVTILDEIFVRGIKKYLHDQASPRTRIDGYFATRISSSQHGKNRNQKRNRKRNEWDLSTRR